MSLEIFREPSKAIQTRITKYFSTARYIRDDSNRYDIISDRFPQEIPQFIQKIPKTVKYVHPALELVYLPQIDYYAVYSTRTIPPNTVLVFEEAVIGTYHELETYLEQHPQYAKDLYPRSWKQEPNDSPFKTFNRLKIDYNIWDWYDHQEDSSEMKNLNALFFYLSKINHSCTPNTFVAREKIHAIHDGPLDDHEPHYRGAYALMSVDMIYAGDEIVTSYSWDTGHENLHHVRKCECSEEYEDRHRNFNRASKLAERQWRACRQSFLSQLL